MSKLGDKVKELRTERMLTQQDLGDSCHWNTWFIDRIESGGKEPNDAHGLSVGTLMLLAAALDVDAAELFSLALEDAKASYPDYLKWAGTVSAVVIRPVSKPRDE